MQYRGIRTVLGFVQVLGWVIAGITSLLALQNPGAAVAVLGLALFGALINHAICGLGLALLDLVERYLAKNPWPSELKPLPRDDGPQATAAPATMPALSKPIPREELLEDGSATPAPGELVIRGDLAPSRPLGEADIARLEAEHRKRERRT